MDCQEIRELLSPYCDNMLEEALRIQLEQHLQHCEQCRQELEELKFVITLMQGSTELLAPADFSGRIAERLASLTPEQGKLNQTIEEGRVKTWFRTWGRVAAVAAILLVAVAIGLEQNGRFDFRTLESKTSELLSVGQMPGQFSRVGPVTGKTAGQTANQTPEQPVGPSPEQLQNQSSGESAGPLAKSKVAMDQANANQDGYNSAASAKSVVRDIAGSASPAPEARKLITNGRLQLEVVNFDSTYTGLLKLVEKYGGYVENSSMSNTPSNTPLAEQYRSGRLTIRVPAGQFNALLAEIDKMETIVFREMGNKDVSAEFYDTQARLRNWKQQEVRLLEILKQAKNVEEILRVEGELQRVRQEVEVMEGRIKSLSKLTELATLDIEIIQVMSKKNIDLPQGSNVLPRAKEAFIGTVNGLLDFMGKMVVMLGKFAPLLIILAVAVGLWLILRYWKGRTPRS